MPRGGAQGWILFAATLLTAVLLAVGAYLLAGYSWNGVVEYVSPYAKLDLPAAATGSSLTSTTVLVIVDGLGDAPSREMEGLNKLRQYGTDLTLVAPQPSLSYPNWTTLLSGAPPYVSGVTTNWFEGSVPVETIVDSASRTGASFVVIGPEDFPDLYDVRRASGTFLRSYPTTYFGSTELVDAAIGLIGSKRPRLAVVHLPDVDNAGHHFGTDSDEYRKTVANVDREIARLVQAVQDEGVAFAIVADHGHIPTGGHGGWEKSVVEVPGVFFGEGIPLGTGNARQVDVAPTVAVLAGLPAPRQSTGDVLDRVVRRASLANLRPAWNQRVWFANEYAALVTAPTGIDPGTLVEEEAHGAPITRFMAHADAIRLAYDRRQRLWIGLAGAFAALLVLAAIGVASWRALVAAVAGTVAYYVLYNGMYFVAHGYRWSLSSFNEETLVRAFFNGRMLEAALAGLAAAAVAAIAYPFMRRAPMGPRGSYLSGWLTLGPATVLAILATLGLQVAWFVWAWGANCVWRLPDLRWGLKYDLDLIQATALGATAVLAPLVTYVVGRYHPKVRTRVQLPAEDAATAAASQGDDA